MEDIKNLEGLEIFLGYKCNVKCEFCYQKNLRLEYKDNISKSKVLKLLLEGFNKGKRFVIFSGGEPTLDINLSYYIEYSKKLGFNHIRVHTNGLMFKQYNYLEELYRKGLTGVTISVHGYKNIHDNVVQVKGSFDIILRALINFEKLKKIDSNFIFDVNTVISKKNYKYIPKLIFLLCKFNFTRSQLVLSYSLGLFSKKEKENIIPKYKDIIPYITKSLDICYKYNKKVVIENIPYCLIGKSYWGNIYENIKVNKSSVTIDKKYSTNLDFKWMVKTIECNKCIYYNKCRGIPEDYLEIYNDIKLSPIYD